MWSLPLLHRTQWNSELKNITCYRDHKIYEQNVGASDLEIILEFPKHMQNKNKIYEIVVEGVFTTRASVALGNESNNWNQVRFL